MTKCCDMRGMLTFTVLRLISKQNMSGEELRKEFERRKGTRPSPGTIYPVLKALSTNGLIQELPDSGKEKKYTITKEGKKEVQEATKRFIAYFCDMKDEF